MNNLIKFLALAALFFYVLCWFTHQPTKLLWYIGIGLPWLSLILSIAVHFFVTSDKDHTGTYWAYTYAIATTAYVVAVSMLSGSIYHQLPHLAACVCFIAYFALEQQSKRDN